MSFSLRTLLFSSLMICCLAAQTFAGTIVLFDESHGQQFKVGNSGPLDLSELATLYGSNGLSVISHADALTEDVLSSVDVLVISGPFAPLAESELAAVTGFINNGGGLAVMLHIAPPVRELLHRLEVDFTNGTMRESQQVIDNNPLNFKVSVLAEHPITTGLEGFSIYGGWALRGTAPHVKVLAATSAHSWIDLNHDGQLSQVDAVQQFGVLVAGELGRGRYVVIGDDAVFQNRYFDEANQQLALQLMGWLIPQ